MTEPVHLLRQLGMREVEESAERLIIDMDNRPDLVTVHFLAPIIEGPARAVATIVRKGKRSIITRSR